MKDWTFDDPKIVKSFDSHVREQLPWYDMATTAVSCLVRNYLPKEGLIYDIGASTGNIGIAIKDILESREAEFVAIEKSEEMANSYNGGGCLKIADAVYYNYDSFSVAVIFLSLMFMSHFDREYLLAKLFTTAHKGGAIIIVDKFIPPNGYIGTIMRRMTMENKLNQGASPKDILEKDLSLSGVQRPLSVSELGPDAVEFFRMGEFAGYIIET
jgi:tRNA (cmo5U34)-methyltransferase